MKIVTAISISERKGMRKKNIDSTNLIENFGLENDAHGGEWHRQVSFLAEESIQTMRDKGLDVTAGNFAENITTEGGDLTKVPVGTHVTIGDTELVISQLGKICHTPCAIYHQAGDCVMPKEGIFAVVKRGGSIKVGDRLEVTEKQSQSAAIISNIDTEIKDIQELVEQKFKPVFIRHDTINTKKGGTLSAIIEDLASTQQTKDIIIIDETGEIGLTLPNLPLEKTSENTYTYKQSRIYHLRGSDLTDFAGTGKAIL